MNGNEPKNMNVIKGLLATAFGIMFMIFAYSIMLRMILFICGALLVYYGLQLLNIPVINNAINTIKSYASRFLS